MRAKKLGKNIGFVEVIIKIGKKLIYQEIKKEREKNRLKKES